MLKEIAIDFWWAFVIVFMLYLIYNLFEMTIQNYLLRKKIKKINQNTINKMSENLKSLLEEKNKKDNEDTKE